MNKTTTLDLHAEQFSFSIGHFTVFSATKRERMHGHHYQVKATMTAAINEAGMTFDYAIYKAKLLEICQRLNCYFILPMHCPYLEISEQGDKYHIQFGEETLQFPKNDVLLLPIKNTVIEEFAEWFLQQLLEDKDLLDQYGVEKIVMHVSNSPEQHATASWHKNRHSRESLKKNTVIAE